MKIFYIVFTLMEITYEDPDRNPELYGHSFTTVPVPEYLVDPEDHTEETPLEIAAEAMAVTIAEKSGRPAFVQKVYSKSKPSF